MSHRPERKEKDCLNCGTLVQGRFCHVCGQENVVPKETFWHMVTHFFYDITHFDSSFFHTVRYLILKPGFLSKEYMMGRRIRYLHPIRMYVFSSAFFFLLFFSVFNIKGNIKTNLDDPVSPEERGIYISTLRKKLENDSLNNYFREQLKIAEDTSHLLLKKDLLNTDDEFAGLSDQHTGNRGKKVYDSLQQALSAQDRDGWLKRQFVYTKIRLEKKYSGDPEEFKKEFSETILHRLPYMLFISLPLFALILKLVYLRRKKFIFADHGVFTIHLYVFTFLLLILVFTIDKLQDLLKWVALDIFKAILILGIYIYLFKAMRYFYEQKWLKTFIKFLLVSISSFVMILLLFILFTIFSAVTF